MDAAQVGFFLKGNTVTVKVCTWKTGDRKKKAHNNNKFETSTAK